MCVLSFGLAYLRSERGAAFFHLCNRILINQLYNTVLQQNIGLLSVALNSSLHECTKLHTRNKYMIFQEIDRFCWRRLAVVIFCSSQVNSVLLSCFSPTQKHIFDSPSHRQRRLRRCTRNLFATWRWISTSTVKVSASNWSLSCSFFVKCRKSTGAREKGVDSELNYALRRILRSLENDSQFGSGCGTNVRIYRAAVDTNGDRASAVRERRAIASVRTVQTLWPMKQTLLVYDKRNERMVDHDESNRRRSKSRRTGAGTAAKPVRCRRKKDRRKGLHATPICGEATDKLTLTRRSLREDRRRKAKPSI